MTLHRLSCALALLAGLLPAGAASQDDLTAAIGKILPSMLTLVARDAHGKELGRGAGFFVTKEGHLMASGHVLHGASAAEVRTADGRVYPVKSVLAECVSSEIVGLKADLPQGSAVQPVKIAESSPDSGARVAVVSAKPHPGTISAVRSMPDFGSVFLLTAPVPPDAVGAPVVDAKGEVVGVALWQSQGPAKTGFAVSAEFVLALNGGAPKSLAEWSASRAKPDSESAYRDGLTLLFLQDFEGALARFAQSIEKDPRCAAAWFQSGFTHGKLGHAEKKIDAYRQAIRLKPDWAEAHYSLGVSYALLGRGKLAIQEHEALKKLSPILAKKLDILIKSLTHEGHDDEQPPKPPAPAATRA